MKKYFSIKKILIALLIVAVVIQFIRIDKTNPPVVQNQDFLAITQPAAEISTLIESACYDCHSNETLYPWYTQIAPVSWWLKDHINEGREELNFSIWSTYKAKKQNHKLKEASELIQEKEMPLSSYTLMHKNARLTDSQRKLLTAFFNSLRGGSATISAEDADED